MPRESLDSVHEYIILLRTGQRDRSIEIARKAGDRVGAPRLRVEKGQHWVAALHGEE